MSKSASVKVYFNLHKHCFSLKYRGVVIAHADQVQGLGVTFSVSEPARQRVITTKKKNVHATVNIQVITSMTNARLTGNGDPSPLVGVSRFMQPPMVTDAPIAYNPYKYRSFVTIKDERPIDYASCITMLGKREVYATI